MTTTTTIPAIMVTAVTTRKRIPKPRKHLRMIAPAIVKTAVTTRTRNPEPRNCFRNALNVTRVRRCHQVRCVVLPFFSVFIDILTAENSQEIAKQTSQMPEKKSTKGKDKDPEPGSSDSDSSSEDSASDSSDAEVSSGSSNSSSGSDSSDEDEASANVDEKAPPKGTKPSEEKSSNSSESSSDSEDESDPEPQRREDGHVAKKRKTSENGAAVTIPVATESPQIARAAQQKEKRPPKVNERFQRIQVQNLAAETILNNGFEARVSNDLSP